MHQQKGFKHMFPIVLHANGSHENDLPNQEKLPGEASWALSNCEYTARAHQLAGLPNVQVVLLLLFLLPAFIVLCGRMVSVAGALAWAPPRPLHLEAPKPPHRFWWFVCMFEKNSSSQYLGRCRALPVTVEAFKEDMEGPNTQNGVFLHSARRQ